MDPPEDVFVPKIRGFSSQSCYFSDFEGVFDICAIIVCLFLMSPSHSRPTHMIGRYGSHAPREIDERLELPNPVTSVAET